MRRFVNLFLGLCYYALNRKGTTLQVPCGVTAMDRRTYDVSEYMHKRLPTNAKTSVTCKIHGCTLIPVCKGFTIRVRPPAYIKVNSVTLCCVNTCQPARLCYTITFMYVDLFFVIVVNCSYWALQERYSCTVGIRTRLR